jgi:uncharacterized UBP type Zn finger protein
VTDVGCSHIPADLAPPEPTTWGCEECMAAGRQDWFHLRLCQTCGHVGCCDQSPGRHATGHYFKSMHPLARSFEPGEDWWWCFADNVSFDLDDAPPSPSHP